MSRLTDLIARAKAKDSQLGTDLEREFRALSTRRRIASVSKVDGMLRSLDLMNVEVQKAALGADSALEQYSGPLSESY